MGTTIETFVNKNRTDLISHLKLAVENLYQNGYFSLNTKNSICQLIIDKIEKNENNHNLSFSTDSETPSFVAFDDVKSENSIKRTKTPLGRYIRRHLGVSSDVLSDTFLDSLVKETIKNIDMQSKIEIISGQKIEEQYRDTSKVSTCMGGPSNCHKVKLYAENPDKVRMITFDKGALRALLWTADDGQVILDRIYPDGHNFCPAIRNWAKSQGFIMKATQGTGEFRLSDHSVRYITLKRPSNNKYPYVDTFQYGKISGDNIILSNSRDNGHNIPLNSTGGTINIPITCKECGVSIHSQNTNEYKTLADGSILCNACYSKRFAECSLCQKIIDKQSVKFFKEITPVCNDCYENAGTCACCEILSQKVFKGKDIFSEIKLDNGSKAFYCVEWCFLESKNICRHCGTWEKNTENTVVIGRKRYCKKCATSVDSLIKKLEKQNKKNESAAAAETSTETEAPVVNITAGTPPEMPNPESKQE